MTPPRRTAPVPTQRRAPDSPAVPGVVVVAVDGSKASVRALVWALQHAASQGWTVEVLTTWPLHGPVFVREVAGHFSEARWLAREAQAEAAARALAMVTDAPHYDLRLANADLVDALVEAIATRAPTLVVLGSDTGDAEADDPRRVPVRVVRAVPAPVVVVGPEGPVEHGPREHAPVEYAAVRRTAGRPTSDARAGEPVPEGTGRAPKRS